MEENTYTYTPPQPPKPPKSQLVATLLSIIPGVGHFYLGLAKQGIQLFLLCILISMIIAFLGVPILSVFSVALWAYGIYDAYKNAENMYIDKNSNFILVDWLLKKHRQTKFRTITPTTWIAIALIVIGAIVVLDKIFMPLFSLIFYQNYIIMQLVKNIIVAGLLIAGGIVLFVRQKSKPDYSKTAYYQSAYTKENTTTTQTDTGFVPQEDVTPSASTADINSSVVNIKTEVSPLTNNTNTKEAVVPEMAKGDDKDDFIPTSITFSIEDDDNK